MSNPIDITQNTAENRFEATINGKTAIITYQDTGDTITYEHTIVPPELGGQGIGSALVKYALEYARDNNKTIIPQCSFVDAYINKHPQYKDLL